MDLFLVFFSKVDNWSRPRSSLYYTRSYFLMGVKYVVVQRLQMRGFSVNPSEDDF